MILIFSLSFVILFISRSSAENRTSNRIFKLPRLNVHTDHLYLQKSREHRLLCRIESGWPGARFSGEVKWFKGGVPIAELKKLKEGEIIERSSTLLIHSGRPYVEGNYQCKAEIEGVRLSNNRRVTVNLISAPLKLKRARITRFTDVEPKIVNAELGSVARIPCDGMPDVIPGPAAIDFQKGEDDESLTVVTDKNDFWVTPTGMQLRAKKYEYAGTYYCIAGNVYTNATRKSRTPVHLKISRKLEVKNPKPQIVYPTTETSLKNPIVVDINRVRSALLECIISNAQITWIRYNSLDGSYQKINIGHDDSSKFRLRFDNLEINWVDETDRGIYVCEGRPNVLRIPANGSFPETGSDQFPKVFYSLRVHSPTNVQLDIGQLRVDKTWQLNCLAQNVEYEIPIVYINGDALQDAMDKLGVPPSTNFYKNPVQVTLTANTILSGSVQCISTPAMDEAEIYGDSLEKGRSINLYVDNSEQMQVNLITQGPQNVTATVGETAILTCAVHQKAGQFYWIKDKNIVDIVHGHVRSFKDKLFIYDVLFSDAGWYTCEATDADNMSRKIRASAYLTVLPNTTQEAEAEGAAEQKAENEELNGTTIAPTPAHAFINISLIPFTMDVPRASVTGRSVRLNWSYAEHHPVAVNITGFKVELKTEYSEWVVTEQLPSHVRGTTIGALVPGTRYKFRVMTMFSGHPSVNSFPTDWVLIEQTEDGIMLPPEPKIEKLTAKSDSSLQLRWKTVVTFAANNAPKKFLVSYGKSSSSQTNTIEVDGNTTQTVIADLEPSTEYRVSVTAENAAGRSPRSQPVYARTHVKYRITSPRSDNATSFFGWVHHKTESAWLSLDSNTVIITMISLLLAGATAFIICVLCCTAKTRRKRITKAAKGKFADTSHRIFNEQLVLKQRLHYNNKRFRRREKDDDEYSPLKSSQMDNHSDSPTSLQNFNFELKTSLKPNLYGEYQNYYNEDAMTTSALINGKRSSSGTNAIQVSTPIMPVERRSANYGELMLCSDSPENSSTPLCAQRSSSKYDGSLYRESASSVGGTSISNLDTNSAVMTLTADKPPVIMRPINQSPVSASTEEERRNGSASRSSQAFPSDRVLQTFKPGSRNTISFLSATLDQKHSNGNISRDGIFASNSELKPINSRYSIT